MGDIGYDSRCSFTLATESIALLTLYTVPYSIVQTCPFHTPTFLVFVHVSVFIAEGSSRS